MTTATETSAITTRRAETPAARRDSAQSHLYRSHMWSHDVTRRLAVTEHRRIVAALEAGDADEAERAAKAHAAGVLVRLMRT